MSQVDEGTIDFPHELQHNIQESGSTSQEGESPDRSKGSGKYKDEKHEEVSTKKRRKRSAVWEHFEELPIGVDGIQYCKCTSCGKMYNCASRNGTGNMKRHINKCPKRVMKDIAQSLIDGKDGSLRSPKFNQEKFRELLMFSIIKHDLPFSFVEYDGIRAIFEYLNVDVKHITRNTAKMDILRLYAIEAAKVKNMLIECVGRICLTSDLWTSIVTDGYMTLTAHFIDKEWNLQKRIMNFSYMPPPHSGVALSEKIFKLLCSWGIEKKVFSITLDNASSNDLASTLLRSQLILQDALICDGEHFHIRCCAHILNLIVQEGMKSIDNSINKIRECVKYVKGSQVRKQRFLDCVSHTMLDCRKALTQDVPTRWNSTYLMLESALYYRRAFVHLQLSDSNFNHCPSEEEWEKVKKICSFLQVFYTVTCTFSGSKYPTSNLYFPQVFMVQLTLMSEMRNSDSFLCKMADQMYQKFEKYWSKYSPVLAIAAVFDPRYKFQLVEFSYKKLYGDKWSKECALVKEKMFLLFETYRTKSPIVPNFVGGSFSQHSVAHSSKGADFFMEFDSFQSEDHVTSAQKNQLELYLDEPRIDRNANPEFDVLGYWKMNQYRYSDLSRMARDILAIPITTVASESAFSTGGRVLDHYRSSLKPDVVEALICTRDWIFQQGVNGTQLDLDAVTQDIINVDRPCESIQHSNTIIT